MHTPPAFSRAACGAECQHGKVQTGSLPPSLLSRVDLCPYRLLDTGRPPPCPGAASVGAKTVLSRWEPRGREASAALLLTSPALGGAQVSGQGAGAAPGRCVAAPGAQRPPQKWGSHALSSPGAQEVRLPRTVAAQETTQAPEEVPVLFCRWVTLRCPASFAGSCGGIF